MDFESVESLRERHPAWRLLRKDNAGLVLSFLGRHFVDENRGATAESTLAAALEDHVAGINGRGDEPRFPRAASAYLDEWARPESGWLRRFYPQHSDEVHFDATSDFEKAYSWVSGLRARAFVGTESRLHTVVTLLRQIVDGTESDRDSRLARLREQRAEIDRQIEEARGGHVDLLGDTAVRDRYQQLARTARELLADFREVEENFRGLDRAARERITAWDGSKGELLAELVASRTDINSSDQGHSFQAFYDFLLSEDRQDELSRLLETAQRLPAVSAVDRLGAVHHDWFEAAERTQQTVRQISEQLRRFLSDQVWLENRRVLDLVREIEQAALAVRDSPPDIRLEVDQPGVPVSLPFERPLYNARPATRVNSMLAPVAEETLDMSALLEQSFIDHARLADNLRAVIPEHSTALLSDVIALRPLEHGAAELLGYLTLTDEDVDVVIDDTEESVIDYNDVDGSPLRVRFPQVVVSRR